jgi:tetratricopeptide (TPR) repeat protein
LENAHDDPGRVVSAALAEAWALKDECYAAWSSALRALLMTARAQAEPPAHVSEVEALADWTTGIAQLTRGEMEDATQSFDRAARIFRSLGQREHATQTQVPKIMALSMLGQYELATECAEQAQREFVALGDVRGAGKVSLNLGALHVQRGAYAQAARYSREASVLFARVGDHQHSVTADSNIADALASMGDFDEALRIYARAGMRARTHGFPVLQALVDGSVPLLQLARGQYREALSGFESARRQYEQLAMPQNVAILEKHLADAYLELRLLPEALALFNKVLSRFQALNMPTEQAWTLAQRGRLQALLGQPVQAADSFWRATVLFAAQGNRVGESSVALARAELALAAGDAEEAEALAAQAGQGFVGAGVADGRLRADVVRAHALLQAGHAEPARALFDATLDRARALQLLTVQVRCLTGQGLVAQDLGQPEAARPAFETAVELFEDQRRALPGDELRSAFLSDHLRPYQELLRMALQVHAQAPSAQRATNVLLQLDRFRARSLGERLAQGGSVDAPAATQGLRDRLNWLYRRVRRLEDDGESSAALSDELRRTELELLERARRERIAAPAPERAEAVDDEFDIDQLQAHLGDTDALVEYGVRGDELFACIVTREVVSVHRRVAPWGEVLGALRAARFQLDTLRHGSEPVHRHLPSLTERAQRRLGRLHELVWAPLAAAVSHCRRLLVVPHAQLSLLPFAALHDGVCTLSQRHELAVVLSARLDSPGRPSRRRVRWRWASRAGCRMPRKRRSSSPGCSPTVALASAHRRRSRRSPRTPAAPTCCTWPAMRSSAATTRCSRRCIFTMARSRSSASRPCGCGRASWC